MARVLFYERVGSHGVTLPSKRAVRIIERSKGRIPRERALEIASLITDLLRPRCARVAVAGSLRRGKASVGDVDIVAVPKGRLDPFGIFDGGKLGIEERGPTRIVLSYRLVGHFDLAEDLHCRVDVRLVPSEAWGACLQYLTGSKLHNICLRALAKRKGLRLNEYGLWDGKKRVAGETEGSVYKALGLKWLPPRYREGPFHLPPEGAKP